ncbi:hypothetical protein AVEN_89686-1 [Araneus ventricosus]|uniref:Uncharacterized protein n=1 Tax=Araneus ventricosus TaxID=182803 RepID=A0A4Y2HIZ5_ARAVE|nr:hypothetical protein AVEN_89686-1 [Araneus ventricosus]
MPKTKCWRHKHQKVEDVVKKSLFSLLILTSRFEITRKGYVGTDLLILNRGWMSVVAPKHVPSIQISTPTRTAPAGERLTTSDLGCFEPTFPADLEWNQVSSLEPPEAEALPPGHRVPSEEKRIHFCTLTVRNTLMCTLPR